MCKTIHIEIPEGYQVDSFDIKTGAVKFKETPKSIFDAIKNIEDVYQYNQEFIQNEYKVSVEDFKESFKYLTVDEISYRQMKLICNTFNEGWIPNWTDSNQRKYFPYFYMGGSEGSSGFRYYVFVYWYSTSFVGSRLCFKSEKVAKHAANLFIEIYKKHHYLTL